MLLLLLLMLLKPGMMMEMSAVDRASLQ